MYIYGEKYMQLMSFKKKKHPFRKHNNYKFHRDQQYEYAILISDEQK